VPFEVVGPGDSVGGPRRALGSLRVSGALGELFERWEPGTAAERRVLERQGPFGVELLWVEVGLEAEEEPFGVEPLWVEVGLEAEEEPFGEGLFGGRLIFGGRENAVGGAED
jgi:hypothetical protein